MLRTESPTRPRSLDELLDSRLIARLGQLDVASRKVFSGKLKGERRSKKRGESVEFADHRPYVVGDDLRHIDWNIYGRLDRLFMKMFLEEEDLSVHVIVDCSASMDCGEPNMFLFVQRAAAALAYIGLVNLHRVTLTAIGGASSGAADDERETVGNGGIVSSLRNLRGRRRVHDLGAWLCGLEPAGATSFPAAAKRIALTRSGKGVMIVISDFFMKEGYEEGLRYLLGRGYDLFAIQALSPQEVDPSLGGDLRLKDVEDADLAEVTISAPLLKRYKANLAAYIDQMRLFCARREITLLTVQSDTPIDSLMLDYLRTRGLLR
ncbi:MAG: DUF58 domain-containing protein [Planctomycetota bacterium]|nr:DUF58 domain-containing protein [Planctomycetota bacterium]